MSGGNLSYYLILIPGGLGEGFVVSLDSVDDDPPLAVGVHGTQGLKQNKIKSRHAGAKTKT